MDEQGQKKMTPEEEKILRQQVEYESAISLVYYAGKMMYDARCLITSSKEFKEIRDKIMKIEFSIWDLKEDLMKDYDKRYQSDRYELDEGYEDDTY